MIDYKNLKGARILFVGINPHRGSYRRDVPFSNNKMFWYLLNRAGLLLEKESDLRMDKSLKTIYDKKFSPHYGLNFANLVDRPTINVIDLEKGEERAGVKRLLRGRLLYWKTRFQHVLWHSDMRLGLANGHRRNKGLSHAPSNQRVSVNSCE